MLLFVKANLSSFIDFLHDSFCFHSHIPFFSMSLLCSVDPQHFVLRQIQLPAHGTAAHGYLSDSVFYSHGTPLSLSHSLTLFLTFFPLPLSWLCELVLVSVLFSTLAPPPFHLFFLALSLFCWWSQTEHDPHTLRSGKKRTSLTREHTYPSAHQSCQSKGWKSVPYNSAMYFK